MAVHPETILVMGWSAAARRDFLGTHNVEPDSRTRFSDFSAMDGYRRQFLRLRWSSP